METKSVRPKSSLTALEMKSRSQSTMTAVGLQWPETAKETGTRLPQIVMATRTSCLLTTKETSTRLPQIAMVPRGPLLLTDLATATRLPLTEMATELRAPEKPRADMSTTPQSSTAASASSPSP